MLDHDWLSRSGDGARQRLPSAVGMAVMAITALIVVFAGFVLSSSSARAQETSPVTIHKRASVEEADIDQTIGYSLTVINNGRVDAPLIVTDPLVEELAYVENSVSATDGQVFFNPDTRTVEWRGTLKANGQATIQFETRVLPVLDAAKCDAALINTATVASADPNAFPLTAISVVAEVKRLCPDLGDAPDSTNHAGAAMTAYPNPVTARYPTVFDPATGAPQGPRHRFARADGWLGLKVSGERDADLMPDEDLGTNILPSSDGADRDRFDDGIAKWPTLANCVQTDMAVNVTVVGGLRTRYINAWIDWNRDGDWEDSFDCPGAVVSEWVVQNFATNLNNGAVGVPLPPFLAWDTPNIPERDRWLRVSIADDPAPRNPATQRADGRGPPTGYRFGETEDYLVKFEQPAEPRLEMVKQADVSTVNPGGVIEYSITVFNSGSAPANGVVVHDPIPAGTTYVAGSVNATAPTATYNGGATRIEWTGNIPAGGSVTIKFKVTVSQDIACDAVIRNRAELMNAAGVLLQDATAFVKINCPGKPILDIKKTANVTTIVPGGVIEYTVTIVNGGTGPASGVTMTDPIPAGTTFITGSETATSPTVSYDNANNWIKWTGNIPVGGSVTITFKVRVSEQIDCGSAIYNKASLVNANNEPVQFAEVRIPVECPKPELAMRKSANPTAVLPGGTIEYAIAIVNSGIGPANGISVIDPIPAGTTYVAGSATSTLPTVTYDNTNNWVKWTGNIPAGGTLLITFKVTVGPNECDYNIHNVARLLDAAGNGLLGAEADVRVGCPDKPLLRMEKKADPLIVGAGGTIEYTVVIANAGSAPASGVTMIDPIPAGTTFVAGSETATAPTVAYDSGNNWIKWNGNIPAGGTVTITFKVTVGDNLPCDGAIHNRAAILGADGTAVAVAEADVAIHCDNPILSIRKQASSTQVAPGGQIEYTIMIANTGTAPAVGVTMIDSIPAGTSYVAGSATATAPTVDDSNPSQIKWTGTVPAGGTVTVTFKVEVSLDMPCGETIWNRAVLFGLNFQLATEAIPVKIICDTTEGFADFGDAPDSKTNHSGMNNTAYSAGPVLGRFPTVWDSTPATEGSGPNHRQANQYWLGDRVTSEKDADLLPDSDGVTNILNNGTADVANQDKADDGWLNPDAPLLDCREAVLKVRISRALIPPPVEKLYLNVWFDGNRDGDWADVGQCPQSNGRSYEWIVQNWWIDPTTIPPAGFVDVAVGTVLVHNAKPGSDAWLRFTLSEQKAVAPSSSTLPDGRGIAFPNAFRLGETEDYYRKGDVQGGEPGQIRIEKKAEPTGPVVVGDIVNYSIILSHVGGTAPATTSMSDLLPAGVALVSGPSVTELTPSAAPLVASFNPGTGPSGEVSWSGTLSPNASIRIDFRVRVRECVDQLRNVAVAVNTNGERVQAVAETKVDCQQSEPGITLSKRVRVQNGTDEVTEADILSSDTAIYYLTLSATDGLTHTVHITDDLPSGLVGVAVSASSGVANLINSGQTAIWDGAVGPANAPITIKILVRPTQDFGCDLRLLNVARWISGSHDGRSNEVILHTACRDLGDAPDSTNNAGVKMAAYSGVEAHFPTVFAVAAPERGPRHDRPRPFHLGKGVTAEVEADLGFDTDGLNNIDPAANKADQDKADDGLLLSTVTLNHCQVGNMRVAVSIDTTAATLLPNGTGYLNIWVDSNRDGDWADRFDCPQSATGAPATALEHIVIDMPINAAALGAGLHTINVNTTGPVAWPADLAQRPAWLRVTLSERPSNKPFTTYGDGRGYDDPFRLGETEDYLLAGHTSQGGEADPVVTKRGEIWPDFNPETQNRRWIVGWIVNYANIGSAPANNVHVVETYEAPQTLVAEHSIPLVPHTQSGNTLDYNVGTLPVGGSGLIIIRTEVPFNTPPGTVIRNSAVINSDNDSVTLNNTTVATVTVPVLPPVITTPIAGTTCTETVAVAGHAQPGVTVDLYVDNALATSLTADSNGDWQTTLTLAAGSHDLHAIASTGSISSPASPTVTVIVDTNLFWNPISLRFVDDLGHTIIPSGRLDESGWSVFLRPGHTYTVSLYVCCEDPNAQVTMEIGDISLTLTDPDGDRTFTATFTVPAGGRLTGTVRICVTCNLIRICSDGQVTIDPEGTVFDLITGQPIAGATVACMQANTGATSEQSVFSLWPAEDYDQINPQSVAADGYFSFFTPQGTYRLQVNKSGYQSYESMDLTVVDAPVHFDVPLTPVVNDDADEQISITESGFEPAVITVEPGTVIEWINAGTGLHSSTSITPSVSFDGASAAAYNADSGAWDSGQLTTGESYKRQMNVEGIYIYQDSANPGATATVIVKSSTPVATGIKVFLPVVVR